MRDEKEKSQSPDDKGGLGKYKQQFIDKLFEMKQNEASGEEDD